jgi:tetratricopeptide (TPR) repeat protein
VPLFAQTLTKAENFYRHTDYRASIQLLDKNSADPATNFLIGRDYFMLADFKQSAGYLQKAIERDPSNAKYMDWLGRAIGRRAETSNPILAFGLASKARQAFERSVQLDPKNSEALSDLFEYYLEAPGFLGGGHDKAVKVAAQMAAVDPAEAYNEKARLAQKSKEYGSAEHQLRQAVAAAPGSIGQLIELAKFLSNQGRTRESDAVLKQAQDAAPQSPRLWFARADLYIKQKRNLDEARSLLQKYMRAPVTVDDPPKEEALRLLKQVDGV